MKLCSGFNERALAVFLVIGCVAGIIGSYTGLRHYEGSALLKPGMVGNFADPDLISFITSPEFIVARLKQPAFYDPLIAGACAISDLSDTRSVYDRIRFVHVRNTPLVEITVLSPDKTVIKPCIEAIYRKIETEQRGRINRLDGALIDRMNRLETRMAKAADLKIAPAAVALYYGRVVEELEINDIIGRTKAYLATNKEREPALLNFQPPGEAVPAVHWIALAGALLGLLAGLIAAKLGWLDRR